MSQRGSEPQAPEARGQVLVTGIAGAPVRYRPGAEAVVAAARSLVAHGAL